MHDTNYIEEKKSTVSQEIIQRRDQCYLWHPWTPLKIDLSKLTLTRGQGYRVWDIDGKEYIDALSLNMTCGYGHPTLIKAINQQLLKLHGFDLSVGSHEPAGLLAERLAKNLPNGLAKTLFVNSGSEGFEAAIFIAASYWTQIGKPRSRVVTFARGYHGSTLISRSLSGLKEVAHPFGKALPVTHVKFSMPPQELRRPESLKYLLVAFEEAFGGKTSDLPMAVVVEPFMNIGGGIVLPPGFLKGLRKLCNETKTLLIIDEVFTGYGRSGKMFAFQYEKIIPDILVSSKGLASGYMPLSAVTVQEQIYNTFEHDPEIGGLRYGHTTSGHAVSCAAALATLDVLETEGLSKRAQSLGSILLEKFQTYVGVGDVVDVRGLGLVLVLEMTSAESASRLRACAESRGLLLKQNGKVIMAVPPLTIDDEGIKIIIERLRRCLTEGA